MLYWDKARYAPNFASQPEFAELERQLRTFWAIEGQIMVQTNELLGAGAAPVSAAASLAESGQSDSQDGLNQEQALA
ncbi:hypothetical protein [Paenibacillus sp. 32352]|uniref:hypothetical protein n=1 Tax=Paenibacillus sp. 32352 TaxID=1969111 RepID=UPI0009ACB8E5|nr:hypothetical protein [Paenibacillus sp. 32352]